MGFFETSKQRNVSVTNATRFEGDAWSAIGSYLGETPTPKATGYQAYSLNQMTKIVPASKDGVVPETNLLSYVTRQLEGTLTKTNELRRPPPSFGRMPNFDQVHDHLRSCDSILYFTDWPGAKTEDSAWFKQSSFPTADSVISGPEWTLNLAHTVSPPAFHRPQPKKSIAFDRKPLVVVILRPSDITATGEEALQKCVANLRIQMRDRLTQSPYSVFVVDQEDGKQLHGVIRHLHATSDRLRRTGAQYEKKKDDETQTANWKIMGEKKISWSPPTKQGPTKQKGRATGFFARFFSAAA